MTTSQRHTGHARYRRVRRALLARDSTCWLCGHGGADTLDHVIPVAQAPGLAKDPTNLRPAHGVAGCPTCGHRCNQERGQAPPARTTTRSRSW